MSSLRLSTNLFIQDTHPFAVKNTCEKPFSCTNKPNIGSGKILQFMGQSSLGARASINFKGSKEREMLRLEKTVFEPLSRLKGSNKKFLKKAYDLLVNYHGLNDVKMRLKIVKGHNNMNAETDYTRGVILFDEKFVNTSTKKNIVSALNHELDHSKKYGDIVCELGVDGFIEREDKAGISNKGFNKKFWHNYVDKNKTKTKRNYDLTPFMQSFFGPSWYELGNKKSMYDKMIDYDKYLQNPFEKTAWKAGIMIEKQWNVFLKKNNMPKEKQTPEDPSVYIRSYKEFRKIDRKLSKKYPSIETRRNIFDKIYQKTEKIVLTNCETAYLYDSEVIHAIYKNLISKPKRAKSKSI